MTHEEVQRRLFLLLPQDTAHSRFNEIRKAFLNSTLPHKRQNALVSVGRQKLDSMVKEDFGKLTISPSDTEETTVAMVLAIIRTPDYHQTMFGRGDSGLDKFIATGDLIELYLGSNFCPGRGFSPEAISFLRTNCFVPLKQALTDLTLNDLHNEPVQDPSKPVPSKSVPSKRALAQVDGNQEFSCSKKRAFTANKENMNPTSRRSPKRKLPITNLRRKRAISTFKSDALEPAKASAPDLQDINMDSDQEVTDESPEALNARPAAGSTVLVDMTAFINEDSVSTSCCLYSSLTSARLRIARFA
ncbi:hypothetical protein C8R42DRAFT_709432 [Lentinula raphanica]|nr:hypothetical protein C8R42DRAFT_709432 [Lentinula raphanica]